MADNFQEWDDEEFTVPESLKGMIVSEVDSIRDTMQVVQLFMGEFFLAGLKLIQELDTDISSENDTENNK